MKLIIQLCNNHRWFLFWKLKINPKNNFSKVENGQIQEKDKENGNGGAENDGELSLNVLETYAVLVKILCLKPMLILVIVLLTGKVKKYKIIQ
jgi:hypothetical protein